MKFRVIIASILLSSLGGFFSCKNSGPKDKPNPEVLEYSKALSSADSCWTKMIASDDNKFHNMMRLTDELLLIDGCDSQAVQLAKIEIEKAQSLRYSRERMGEKGAIDRHDSLTDLTLASLRKEVARNPNAVSFQIVNQLVSEINQADDSVLFFRKEYDHQIDKLNQLLKAKKKEITQGIPSVDSIESFPVFRLNP